MNPSSSIAILMMALVPFNLSCKTKSKSPANPDKGQQSEANGHPTPEIEFNVENQFRSAEGKKVVQEFRLAQADLEKPGDRLILFAKCGDPEGKSPTRLERVKDPKNWPGDCLVMYVFLLDAAKRVRLFQVVPNSESGDWYEQNDYLYSSDGSLQYWEHYFGSFDPDQPKKAWHAFAWSSSGASLDNAAKFADPDGHPWKGAAPKPPAKPPMQLRALLDQLQLTDSLPKAKVELPTVKKPASTGAQDA